MRYLFSFLFVLHSISAVFSQTPVGSGSYTNSHPGNKELFRDYPGFTPQLSGAAQNKPIPTNDWWSLLLKENHVNNLFNYPLTMRTTSAGLGVTYVAKGVVGDKQTLDIGVQNLNASNATVENHTDWTVKIAWTDNARYFSVTSGIGMPFLYFTKGNNDVARIEVKAGIATVSNEMILIKDTQEGVDYAVYAPTGSTWTKNGSIYTSTLNGKNYWSAAILPQSNSNPSQLANTYKKFAYVFPADTKVSWNFNESTSVVRTTFQIIPDVKEGSNNTILQGLLPHQWDNLATDSPQPNRETYENVRGDIKMLDGNEFYVENTFYGVLPTLPYLANYSSLFNSASLSSKIDLLENDNLNSWQDSYNQGQLMNRLVQSARIAHKIGDIEARDKLKNAVKERLEDWLSYELGEIDYLFYYNNTWTTLLGYPAGHGQDHNINDHHFHWGYFIHAAAFMEQFEPGWANQWGGMIDLLIRDAASSSRSDDKFPFLRNFSPYAGHAWANGFATFPNGNDQESTSESMQFNTSLIHWGSVTGNDTIRDLGIYLYTTEQTAVEEYWFDMHERVFSADYGYSVASRVWGNSYDSGTFWTNDKAATYGIELYPIHGGSLYLGHNTSYVTKLWNEMKQKTGIMSNEVNDNLWHDIYWSYAAFVDPDAAITLYNSYPDRSLKFGISDAHTYYWLHNMKALGTVRTDVTANHPIAAAFEVDGQKTYVAHNYSDTAIDVDFSDGFSFNVPAQSMKTNRGVALSGVISSDFYEAYNGGSVNLTVNSSEIGITKVEFYGDNGLIATDTASPYTTKADNLTLGTHGFYAKIYNSTNFGVTNSISVVVGEQKPYLDVPFQIPGTIQSGNYDYFEGGKGQNISYYDTSIGNNGADTGNFRTNENVDAVVDAEGKTVGWIEANEWLEYTINVSQSGKYKMNYRYASADNSAGPFHLELNGQVVSADINVDGTGSWSNWATDSVSNIDLLAGEHVLRVAISGGGFNLGDMSFVYESALGYTPLVAEAGSNITVQIPATTSQLDGSQSSIPNPSATTYLWKQVYGPTVASFDNTQSLNANISNLIEGIYKFELTLTEGTKVSKDEVYVNVQSGSNSLPNVSLTSPNNGDVFSKGDSFTLTATASDFDGTITKVIFYEGTTILGEDNTQPYTFAVDNATVGTFNYTVKAIDNAGGESVSTAVSVTVNQRHYCTFNSSEASQGQFSVGYNFTFETIGNSVKFTAELLDTDKTGAPAYLFRETPFSETSMDDLGNNMFSKTLGGFSQGQNISYGVKFSFTGGVGVTKYFQYEVGSSCVLSVRDVFDVAQVFLYPNPIQDKFHIKADGDIFVEVYDISGNKLKANKNKEQDISAFGSGIYFVRVSQLETAQSQLFKIVKK
jgi:endoglucanase Acf2